MNINKELLLAVIITGLGVCVPYVMMDGIMLRDNLLTVQSGLYMANMLVYMLVAVNIAFLFSKVAANDQVVSMLSNIVGLGMAFLSGVFVPMQYLGAGVIRVAHFLPAYWYVIACENIYKNGSGKLVVTLQAMGVQVLFAVAIFMITLVVGKNKRVYRTEKGAVQSVMTVCHQDCIAPVFYLRKILFSSFFSRSALSIARTFIERPKRLMKPEASL